MRNPKPLLLSLVFVLGLVLAACSAEEPGDPNNPGNPPPPPPAAGEATWDEAKWDEASWE